MVAAFASSLYVESATGIACLVPPSAHRGPLNVVLPAFRPGTPELRGAAWRRDGPNLLVDGLGSLAISPRDEWIPPRLPSASPCALRAGLASMRGALAARALRGEVLSHVLGPPFGHSSPGPPGASAVPGALAAHFGRSVPALSRWLDEMVSGRGTPDPDPDPAPVADLLGAGGGLTPSGDDCLVGLLVALHALGEFGAAASVARLVARHAPHRTTRLSAAHLAAACAGQAIEPVHGAIEAIATGASPEPALDSLESFGHGSGFDALAGVLLAAGAIAHNLESGLHVHRHGRTHGVQASVHRHGRTHRVQTSVHRQ